MRGVEKYLLLVGVALLFLSSCAEWKRAAEEGDRVQFDVEHPDGKREKRRKPEEQSTAHTATNTSGKSNAAVIDKYAGIIGVDKNQLKNSALYEYIDSWMGVPYKYGGNTKDGVDCSGFVNAVYKDVYRQSLKRSATEIILQCNTLDKSELRESDLVFFDISGKNSHVGIYLANNRFVHASTSKGVMISSLTESYWTKNWGRAGRLK